MKQEPRVVVAPDPEQLAHLAAEEIIGAACRASAPFTLALSGGATPRTLYSLLGSSPYCDRVAWENTHLFFADERCVPPDHPDSNFGMVNELLISRIRIPAANVHRMVGESCSATNAAQEYELKLAITCPFEGTVPVLDFVLLGIGEDGHTASLFPDSHALAVRDRWVVANRVPRLEAQRLTLTLPVLATARRLTFLVSGTAKAAIVGRVAQGEPSLPAAQAIALNERSSLLLDIGAASQLGL